jgi:transposase
VRALIKAKGACLLYLPPYSPDFNPIENLLAKVKVLLRREAARTIDTLWTAIGRILDLVTPREWQNILAAAGYSPN